MLKLDESANGPLVVLSGRDGSSADVRAALAARGAVLIRNTAIDAVEELSTYLIEVFGREHLMRYEEDKVSPRTRLGEFVYTSTEYRKEAQIFMHNECCTRLVWPMHIAFFCKTSTPGEGQTPICDVRRVASRVPTAILEEFRDRDVGYIRNLGGVLGNSLQYTFGTADRDKLARIFEADGMTPIWKGEDRVQLTFRRKAFVRHSLTGEDLWFNNALFWHPASLDRVLRMAMRNRPVEELAFYSTFGDGGEIPNEHLQALRSAYDDCSLAFDWREGDLLLLDNMRFAHGRLPFSDARRNIWVAMANPSSAANESVRAT